MKTLLAALCWLIVAAAAHAGFDSSGWSWQRPMDVQSLSGFVSLPIPPEVFDESQPSLPLTSNGKISGQALLEWHEVERSRIARASMMPLTGTQGVVAAVWARLLRVEVSDPRADFFSIGGDSIFSIQLVAELQKHGFAVAVADIFKFPSLEQLAALCDERAQAQMVPQHYEPVAPFVLVAPADREKLPADLEDAYPLTALQLAMLFHTGMEQGVAVYHDVFSYDLQLDYRAAAFHAAIQRVVDEQPVLRTSFDLLSYSQPLQLVRRR